MGTGIPTWGQVGETGTARGSLGLFQPLVNLFLLVEKLDSILFLFLLGRTRSDRVLMQGFKKGWVIPSFPAGNL